MTKTNKAFAKRIKMTGGGKLLRRATGQNHFNAKESGRQGRKKHHLRAMAGIAHKKIMRRLPSL